MITITINTQTFQLPENFNEFTAKQIEFYFGLLQQKLTKGKFASLWLLYFLQEFPDLVKAIPNAELAKTALEVQRIMRLTAKPLVLNKLPKLLIGNNILIGTKDYLSDVWFGRFVEADEAFWLYTQTKDIKYLHQLTAILYLYDTESEYDNAIVPKRTQDIAKFASQEALAVIYEYYAGSRDYITKRFPLVFPKAKEETGKSLKLKNIKEMREAFNKVMIDFAVTPDRKAEQYKTNLYTTLEFVERNIEKNNELEKLYNKK